MDFQKICRNCGTACSDEFKFCPNCGASMQDAKCKNCGAELIGNAKFCVNCGMQVAETKRYESIPTPTAEHDSNTESEFIAEDKVSEKKPRVHKAHDKAAIKKIVRLVKDISLVVLCVILFALSFCDIIKINSKDYISEDYDVEVSFSAVDCIGIMGATARVNGASDKYEEKLEEIAEELEDSIIYDYNGIWNVKIRLSAKSKELISEYMICLIKYEMTQEETAGTAACNHFIIIGVLCLIDIVFTACMLAFSICSLILNLLKKKNRIFKFFLALPVSLFMSMLIVFMLSTMGLKVTVASAMCANLFFGALALVATVAVVFILSKKRPLKIAIPKLVSVAMSIIICACLFAPFFTAKYDLTLANKSHESTYTADVDASGLLTYLSPDEIEELSGGYYAPGTNVYSVYMQAIQTLIDNASNLTSRDFGNYGGILSHEVLDNIIKAIGDYELTGAIAIGYYVLILVFLLFGAFAAWSIAKLFSKKHREDGLLYIVVGLLVIAITCSICLICVANFYLDDFDITQCSFTIGGGAIAAIVLLVVSLIATGIFRAVSQRTPKPVEAIHQYYTESVDVE